MLHVDSVVTGVVCAAWLLLVAVTAVGVEVGLRLLIRRAHICRKLAALLRRTAHLLVIIECGLVLQFAMAHPLQMLLRLI